MYKQRRHEKFEKKNQEHSKKNNFISTRQWGGNYNTKGVHMCVCKTRILSVELSVCMSELKREDTLVFTYMCMFVYMRVSWYV